MAKYRKKPVVIEATQWFKHGDHPAVGFVKQIEPCMLCRTTADHGGISTPNGDIYVCPGDWIITGSNRQVTVCKPDIFEATYEIADDVTRAIYNVLDGKPLS